MDPLTDGAPDELGVEAIVGAAARGDVGDADLAARIEFLMSIDALKLVLRRSSLTGGSRRENSAEHSWHLALFALVLAPYAAEPIALERVLTMVLVHDLVEIEAGDTFVYDDDPTKAERERAGAERIFGLLPGDQGRVLRECWEEFERGDTADARFARALDRLQPVLLNIANDAEPWRAHDIAADRIRSVNAHISDGAPALWDLAAALIDAAVHTGLIADTSPDGELSPDNRS